ncbi:MAG: acyl-CoA thioesterase, partial [Crocinitomicaceae bacterium]
KNLEENGILLPVTEFNISYKQAAKYDDILEIKTKITKLEGTRITFQYEVFNEAHIKLNEAETTLVFVDSATMKPIPVPTFILNLVNHG